MTEAKFSKSHSCEVKP